MAITSFDIKKTVAFVTGTNKKNGIGRAIVKTLLQQGVHKVYATARDVKQLDELVDSSSGRVVAISLDVTDTTQMETLGQQYPDVNLVINNAGYAGMTSSLDDAVREIEVNYIAPLQIVHSFADSLKKNGTAAVVNIASISSFINFPGLGTYSASKAALHSLTQSQRRDFGKDDVLVVGVYPGPVDTEMAEGFPFDKVSPSTIAESIMDALKVGKEDVFPDPMAVGLYEKWQSDAKAVEEQMAGPNPF